MRSQCSVSCGEGAQARTVTCMNQDGTPMNDCEGNPPAATQPCLGYGTVGPRPQPMTEGSMAERVRKIVNDTSR